MSRRHNNATLEMTGEAAAAMSTIQTVQSVLTILASLSLTAWKYPLTTSIADGTCFDYVIVGGGTAGCVLANRLSANENFTVAVIEAGQQPRLESWFTGMFPVTRRCSIDMAYNSTNDNRTAQHLQNKIVSMTAGKMLGGSSGLNDAIMVNGTIGDYALWAEATNDSSWNHTNLQPYVEKIAQTYMISKNPKPENDVYFKAYAEMGYNYTSNSDANQNGGVENPYLSVHNNWRQSAAEAYITPILNRTNVNFMYNSQAIKINFDSNNVATGVQVIDASGNNITICANKEVVLTAGAIGTAHLLLLSGVGPTDNLDDYDIPVVSDLPVGATLRDHPSASVAFVTEPANVSSTPINYGQFPVPVMCSYDSINTDSLLTDFQTIDLLFTPQSQALLQLGINAFKYEDDICDAMYTASESRNLWYKVANLLHPVSTGNLTLQSANYSVQPKIYHGMYSNDADLANMARMLQKMYINIMNTTYFISNDAELVDLKLSECAGYDKTSNEYWEAYALALSGPMWHTCCTCPMGSVTDSTAKVVGTSGLRVCDAAAMPCLTSGNIQMPVMTLAEKCADMILTEAVVS